MPRPKRTTPASKRTITLPDDLWLWLDNRNIDPLRGKRKYGSLSTQIERLVRTAKADIERLTTIEEE